MSVSLAAFLGRMSLRSKRSLEALRLCALMSDRQRGLHVCIRSVSAPKCWCRVEDGLTEYPHSHGVTGNMCTEVRCEWHTQLTREQVELGQVGQWS